MRPLVIFALSALVSAGALSHANSRSLHKECAVKICSLDPDYSIVAGDDWGKDDARYKAPQCQDPDQATNAEKKAITRALQKIEGQSKLHADLCGLANIFIDKNGTAIPRSWGFWEDPSWHTAQSRSFIAISVGDLKKSFSDKQEDQRKHFGHMGGHDENGTGIKRTPEVFGLIYTLAHELAHIKWHRDNSSCKDSLGKTWKDTSRGQKRFTGFARDFGDRDFGKIPKPTDASSQDDLDKIYSEFVTTLAAANPEEDFVESYTVRATSNACAGCKFNYKITKEDVVTINGERSATVTAKFACVDDLLK